VACDGEAAAGLGPLRFPDGTAARPAAAAGASRGRLGLYGFVCCCGGGRARAAGLETARGASSRMTEECSSCHSSHCLAKPL